MRGRVAKQFRGRTLIVLGTLLNGLAFLGFVGSLVFLQVEFIAGILSGLIGIVLGVLGHECKKRGKQIIAPSASELLSEDSRPPVLYLRSFKSEQITSEGMDGAYPGLIANSEEEGLAKVMNEIGPFITIGVPGEKYPSLGAARLYVENESWKTEVLNKILQAALVLIRIGATKGLIWEVQQCISQVSPDRLILLVPKKQSLYDEFKENVRGVIRYDLPDYPDTNPLINIGSVRGFIRFAQNGNPEYNELIPPKGIKMKNRSYSSPLALVYKYNFKNIFEQLGIEWNFPN